MMCLKGKMDCPNQSVKRGPDWPEVEAFKFLLQRQACSQSELEIPLLKDSYGISN